MSPDLKASQTSEFRQEERGRRLRGGTQGLGTASQFDTSPAESGRVRLDAQLDLKEVLVIQNAGADRLYAGSGSTGSCG